jgi:hypothetical protein
MSYKMLFVVPLIGSLVFAAMQGTSAASAPPVPALTHTMTIYNGPCETQATFVWQNGQWRSCDGGSPCRPEKAACPERTCDNQVPVERHCR